MEVDWTQLPPELAESISKKLTIYADYLRFRVVCHSWRASVPKTPHHLPPQLPWLMLPQSQPNQSHRAFFSLSNSRVHFLHLPEASHRKRRCGSSHGWLVILDETPSVLLVNPLTRAKRHLPPLSTFPNVVRFDYSDVGREYALVSPSGDVYTRSLTDMRDSFLKKVVLSSSPLEARGFTFTAVAIVNQTGDLAFCRDGDQTWTFIDGAQSYSEDVVSVNGLFYAVDKKGTVAECDVNGPSPPRVRLIRTPRLEDADMRYLVSSGDDLLLVSRYLEIDYGYGFLVDNANVNYRTAKFDVFRMNWLGERWDKVENLGDRMVFIGENSSFSLSASDFPGSLGNCVYFTDDYSESNNESGVWGYDSGIFKLWDGTIQELPPYPRNSNYEVHWPAGSLPLWVTPNPC
ncbi:hypothetical protein C1H46_006843 [Malus baccata]|uniref:Uncharacterized protein n=1 Tax=Malus baccata TaxID=106549 RepID=A0A540NAC1_MALBA|nr:hypothetical protein C1H46_006843 [Malus baccata]